MIFGLSTASFTLLHVLISLVAIAAGFIALFGLISGRKLNGWNTFFLATTVATSVTGFGFPFNHLLPSHIVGVISLVVLAIAIVARYLKQLSGRWRGTYAICASIALYLNFFVAVAQSFQKVPALKALAPTQTEPPFAITQLIVLVAFTVLGFMAAKKSPRQDAHKPPDEPLAARNRAGGS